MRIESGRRCASGGLRGIVGLVLATWYEHQGRATDVLVSGEMPDPEPGPGEVRVRLNVSGVNPGDTKKRAGWLGGAMAYPRVIPHSDGVGVIDAVGSGVDSGRIGQRVWIYGAQSYRPYGTAAQFTTVPDCQAVELPRAVSDDVGAALGIPGITAHRLVFADGPIEGRRVLVHGVLGAVGSLAAQLARWKGASVIGTVRRAADVSTVGPGVCDSVISLDDPRCVESIRELAPDGVDRVIEVSLSDNADLDNAVVANGAVIAAYATRNDRPSIPFWHLLFNNVTIRLTGSDDFPADATSVAAKDLTDAAAVAALRPMIGARFTLDAVAASHDFVDSASRGRALIAIPP